MAAPGDGTTTLLGFRSHLRVEQVPGEAVYLLSDQRVTALHGEQIARLAPLLDGTRTREELVEALTADAVRGELKVARNNQPVTEEAAVRDALTAVLDPALTTLAGHALLVG